MPPSCWASYSIRDSHWHKEPSHPKWHWSLGTAAGSTPTTIRNPVKQRSLNFCPLGEPACSKTPASCQGLCRVQATPIPPPSNQGCPLLGPYKGFSAPCTAQATEALFGVLLTQEVWPRSRVSNHEILRAAGSSHPTRSQTRESPTLAAWPGTDFLPGLRSGQQQQAGPALPQAARRPGSWCLPGAHPLCRLQPGPVSHQGGASCVSSGDSTLHYRHSGQGTVCCGARQVQQLRWSLPITPL